MAAIARKSALLICFALSVTLARADQSSDARAQLRAIASGLTAGSAVQAMVPFDESCPNYTKLSNDFEGLTNAFRIDNEIDVNDEEDAPSETKLTVIWTITLTDLGTNFTEQRRGTVNIRLVLKGRHWKIVEFAPIEIFDPQQKPPPASKP